MVEVGTVVEEPEEASPQAACCSNDDWSVLSLMAHRAVLGTDHSRERPQEGEHLDRTWL